MSDTDTLLVCLYERDSNGNDANCLVALSRTDNKWSERHRLQPRGKGSQCCALSNSRVLVGAFGTTYLEMFRVQRNSPPTL